MPRAGPRRYLLDTNIVSALVRDPHGAVTRRIARVGEEKVCTSIIVACELRFGATKKGSPRLTEQLERVLAALPVLALEADADRRYGELRTELERAGTPIGANDMLIAAHALALDLTLVTDNVSEFRRVKGLQIRNWLTRSP
jgi:tRNA(fMet)-specific endonuclease VapC